MIDTKSIFVVTIPLEFNELVLIFGFVVTAAGYFVAQGFIIRRLRKETKNQREVLKVVIMSIAETMDKDRALQFIEHVFIKVHKEREMGVVWQRNYLHTKSNCGPIY